MERTKRRAGHHRLLGGACGVASLVGRERHDRIEPRIEFGDRREMRVEHFERAHGPRSDEARKLARRLACQADVGHTSSLLAGPVHE
jgi:hypothetical protein